MFEFTLYLIRHGESEGNVRPDIIGQTPDVPLTERGKEQSRALKKRFLKKNEKFDFVFSSTYKRALTTCLLSIPDDTQKVILVPELKEYNPGDWLGKSRKEIYTPDVINKMNVMGQDFCPPNGESCTMVERRASTWLEEAVINNQEMHRYYDEHGEVKIACFSHGGTIKGLLHYIMGFDKTFTWKVKISNTSISKVSFADGWSTMHCVNDTAHLEV